MTVGEKTPPSSQAGAEPGGVGDNAFDPLAYIQSSVKEPESLRSLPALVRNAVGLARRASPRLFWLNTALGLATGVLLGLQIFAAKMALESVFAQAGGGSLGKALPPLVLLVALTSLGSLIAVVQQQVQRVLAEEVQQLTWTQMLEVTTRVRLETFESPVFFDDLQRVRTNALLRPVTLSQGLIQLLVGAVSVIGLSTALLLIEPLLVPVLILGGLPLWLLSRRTGRIEFDFRVGQTPLLRMREYLTELLCGRLEAKEIRAFGLGPVIYERWQRNYDEYLRDYRHHVRRRVVLASAGAVVTAVVTTAALAILLWLVVDDQIALASAGAGLIAIRLLSGRIDQMFHGVTELFESALFLRDLDRFTCREQAVDRPTQRSKIEPFREVTLENVSFRYPGSSRYALKNVSLTLRAGEVVALVGENGSGKTTLAKLLADLYEPTSGRILWNGVDIRDLDPVAVRRQVGAIFQDFVRYQLTVRENVGFGRPEAIGDLAAIEDAARRGGAHSFIEQLPSGYETGLGKEFFAGHDLSIGQWQRLAISRAFFREAGFIVLDEPTASLDARSEHELFERVQGLAAGRCLLLISHRFSTVKSADRIYVLTDGELIEQGNHDELMGLGGRYAELFSLQASAYR